MWYSDGDGSGVLLKNAGVKMAILWSSYSPVISIRLADIVWKPIGDRDDR